MEQEITGGVMLKNTTKTLLLILLLLSILPCTLFSQSSSDQSSATLPVPYEDDEFPEGVNDLRRFEQIFFGAFPLSILFSQLLGGAGLMIQNVAYSGEAGGPEFEFGVENYTVDDKVRIIAAGVGISFGIAVIDMIIYQTKKTKATSQYQRRRILSIEETERQVALNAEIDEDNTITEETDEQIELYSPESGIQLDDTFSELIAPESFGE